MWRKIHSNRDPRDTLFSEIRKEFRPWFFRADKRIRLCLRSYPRFVFGIMAALLLISFILSFTVFRHPEKPGNKMVRERPDPVQDGFNQIIRTSAQLRQTLLLKHIVDSLTAKKQLSAADSQQLNTTLDRLRKIHPNSK